MSTSDMSTTAITHLVGGHEALLIPVSALSSVLSQAMNKTATESGDDSVPSSESLASAVESVVRDMSTPSLEAFPSLEMHLTDLVRKDKGLDLLSCSNEERWGRSSAMFGSNRPQDLRGWIKNGVQDTFKSRSTGPRLREGADAETLLRDIAIFSLITGRPFRSETGAYLGDTLDDKWHELNAVTAPQRRATKLADNARLRAKPHQLALWGDAAAYFDQLVDDTMEGTVDEILYLSQAACEVISRDAQTTQ